MIRLLALDVDGTLTDGGLYVDGSGHEMKRFDVQDGMGIRRFRDAGGHVVIISARQSSATEQRARELSITVEMNGDGDKLEVLQSVAQRQGLKAEEVAYVGDDVNDIDCIRWAGLGFAVANAQPEVCDAADRVTTRSGGHGAVREVVEFILKYNVTGGC